MTSPTPDSSEFSPSRVISGLAVGGLFLLGTLTLLGFLGGVWWVFDLAAALRTQYAIGLLLIAGGFGLLRSTSMVVVSLVGVAINAAFLLPLYLDGPPSPTVGSEVLRVMFLNVEISGADPDLLIEDLRTANHDLVFLAATHDGWADAMRTASIPYAVVQSRPQGVDVELLTLAREDLSVETTLQDFGTTSRDIAVQATVALGDSTVHVLAMHPVSPITPNRAQRNTQQLSAIASWARAQEDPKLILGDLNATPWSSHFRNLLQDGNLVNSQVGFGVQASWPAWLGPFGIPIDHALHSQDLVTVERSLASGYGSDHRSIHVAVSLSRP